MPGLFSCSFEGGLDSGEWYFELEDLISAQVAPPKLRALLSGTAKARMLACK